MQLFVAVMLVAPPSNVGLGQERVRRLGEATAIYMGARRESLEPSQSGSTPFAPTGGRTLWSVSLGVVMGREVVGETGTSARFTSQDC